MDQGFCGMPITPFVHDVEDIQLNILEHYLIKLISSTDFGQTNTNDFGLLTKEISVRRPSSSIIDANGLFGSSFIPLKLGNKKLIGKKAAIAETILNVMLPVLMSGLEKEKNQPEEEEEKQMQPLEEIGSKSMSLRKRETGKIPSVKNKDIEPRERLFNFEIVN
jgi:hypothetical protein